MTLRLHNTLGRRKQPFEPIDGGHVRMYVCGPTVYDDAHIGNARPVVVFDVLYRLLRALYPKVTYVRNITDVDDKINARAAETGEDIRTITGRTAERFGQDMKALNTLPPDHQPRATDHIPEMIAMIETLLAKGHAYEAAGHILFAVDSWRDYGKLSGHNRDQIIAGARVEIAPYKKDPADFVLWKPSTGDEPGWDSPWGFGRPGWHLECSAMSNRYLGREFDIHGGGQDLIFPHHENEIAQSRCCHGTKIMARYWLHNGYLMAEGEKMSKSLGNFYTVHDLLDEFPGEAIRLTLLKTHYRQPLDFTKNAIRESKKELDRWYRLVGDISVPAQPSPAIIADLEDDLNTPRAIAGLRGLAGEAAQDDANAAAMLLGSANFLGLLQQDQEQWFKGSTLDSTDIEALIELRAQARTDKDFAKSDRIRDDLAGRGIILEDGAGGTTWRRN